MKHTEGGYGNPTTRPIKKESKNNKQQHCFALLADLRYAKDCLALVAKQKLNIIIKESAPKQNNQQNSPEHHSICCVVYAIRRCGQDGTALLLG